MATPPTVNRRIIEALLETRLPQAENRDSAARLILVHGRYEDAGPAEFTLRLGTEQRQVRITHQDSVLGIVTAWQDQLAAFPDPSCLLVVTTAADATDLGADLRAHALGRRVLPVDRAEIVRQRFAATALDPRIRTEGWLVDGLLDAEPAAGWRTAQAAAPWWRSGGSLLTRDIALRCLAEARLRLHALTSGAEGTEARATGEPGEVDLDLLLAWSQTSAGPALFARLAKDERDGLAEWLREQAGEAATVLLALAGAGRGADAMALGTVAAALLGPVATEVGMAVGELFSGLGLRADELRTYSAAVHGTLERWIGEAESQRAGRDQARRRVLQVLQRADALAAASPELLAALAQDAFLPSGFAARLRALAVALAGPVDGCETALARLVDHRLARLYPERCQVARMAVRVRRWLSGGQPGPVESVAQAISTHVADWGWVDRALAVLWTGDPVSDRVVAQAYRTVFDEGRAARRRLDESFAAALPAWAKDAASSAPGGCLLIEDVLEKTARPLTTAGPPLVLVLDGMSSAVAAQLGEELTGRGWLEISPRTGARQAAVSMIPSVTTVSRASLLSGKPLSGGQAAEKEGFAAFWATRGHQGALLLHMRDVEGGPGHRLSEELLDALAGPAPVAVVLNSVDDALDHGREGSRTGWHLADIAFLEELLAAAHGYDRPVLLVADHGHVLDRSAPGERPTAAAGAVSARWRTGPAGPGEVELAGPRVLEGGGRITAAWREDIRYTPRKAGYHGGASLAEMTVPLLAMLPPGAQEELPEGWSVLPAEQSTPSWWSARAGQEMATDSASVQQTPPSTPKAKRRVPAPERTAGLFTVEEIPPAPAPTATRPKAAAPASLGARVVAAKVYTDQQRFVRKPPERAQVAAVIDALAAAGNHLSLPAVGAAAAGHGRAPRSPEFFVTMLERLLNVEGYPVLDVADGGRTVKLDPELLKEQFQLEDS